MFDVWCLMGNGLWVMGAVWMCGCALMYVDVCVDHLKRCKTSYSFDLVQFYFVLAGGQSHVCS